MDSRPRMRHVSAALLGALLTPVATGLSLQLLPMVPPLLLYAVVGLFYGYRWPELSWRWGLWISLGILLVTTVVGVGLLVGVGLPEGSASRRLSAVLEFVRVTGIFTVIPGFLGSCGGAYAGSRWTSYSRA